ncbi:MAG: triose-phosphate isomerase [Candidatus Methanoliparum thermophilum]|uniref:Triosephosphate isomerase n=1 Tax=Methanoliparum thermophilum TaxID=2491083 RepID=A0A520KQY4_METT2|nr:triose-phosphate isomerase [Candidatus Methanoliparum sp. LAM-1]RZN64026.1 MAG: triose-phosphate isomerase [Candidatus Methanoliparum thermophilum]BDC35720.1 triose-phosphate isomerase [Candidatus Methanoliparum sp. LAM-1]
MLLKPPFIILNMKSYQESSGENGLNLAKICEDLAKENDVSIMICPQQVDLTYICKNVTIPCLSQHVDPIESGGYTGWVSINSVKNSGAKGSLINHSEHKMNLADTDLIIGVLRSFNLISIVCANNEITSRAVAELRPDFVAIEPPELIGTGVSVSSARPEVVSHTVESVKYIDQNIKVLCGAGISNGEDVRSAVNLGADGILLASGVIKAKNQKKALLDLISYI